MPIIFRTFAANFNQHRILYVINDRITIATSLFYNICIMKKLFFLLAACIVCFSCTQSPDSQPSGEIIEKQVIAERVRINNLSYNLFDDNTAEIVSKQSSKYIGSLDIPNSIEYQGVTYRVTSIGAGAFMECSNLTSINIPNSINSIGIAA